MTKTAPKANSLEEAVFLRRDRYSLFLLRESSCVSVPDALVEDKAAVVLHLLIL